VRLDPAEVRELPLPAALLDRTRAVVAATPEWPGWAPGAVTFHAGHGYMAVGGDEASGADRGLVLDRLLDELDATVAALAGDDARRARLLAAGLRLVAGTPPDERETGTGGEVLAMAAAGIAARVGAPFSVSVGDGAAAGAVPCPAVVALALVQLAVNVARHERADPGRARPVKAATLAAAAGPTFHVEWASEAPRPTPVRTHRHVRERRRWGLGYVRMAADALGGTALPPAPCGSGRARASFGLGSRNLTLPLALWDGGRVVRSTRAWDQEHHAADAGERAGVEALVQGLARAASERCGEIVRTELHTARAVPGTGRVWMALPPEGGDDRVVDVLRGLDHERLLLTAVEPHATRLHALNAALRASLGDPLATCYAGDWRTRFPAACRGLGVTPPRLDGVPAHPDPRLTALLLHETAGRLRVDAGGAVWLEPAPGHADTPLLRLLGPDQHGRVRLTGGLVL
jgi:hypothetical protein